MILDHLRSLAGVEYYAEVIEKRQQLHGWKHGTDFVPHDAKVKEFGSGQTRVETMQTLGLSPQLVPAVICRTASTQCGARCRCACFIRAAKRPDRCARAVSA